MSLQLNRKKSPAIEDAVNFNLSLKPYELFVLDNGVKVYAVNAGEQEVMMVEWVFEAGNWFEKQNLVAASANFLLKNGTQHKSAFEINEHFEQYGAYLNRACYNETSTITLHTLNKHIEHLLPVVREILTEATFPESELAIYQQNQKQRLEVNLKKCDFVANRLIDEYIYGFHHPYGKYSSTLDYDQLNTSLIQEFYKQYYLNGNCTLFVAGKLPQNIFSLLNQYFGKLPLNQHKLVLPEYAIQPEKEKKHFILNDANGVQGAIRIGKSFHNRHHPDFPKMQVLNNVFGGFFGSRLMSNIREDKGYTYGIYSYLQNHIHASALMISTEAGREVCEATIQEVYKEMEILCNDLIEEEELNLVRNYMIGTLLGDLDGPFQIISRWKNYLLNNLDEQYFYNSLHIIRTISSQDLRSLAQQYLQPNSFYELVVV